MVRFSTAPVAPHDVTASADPEGVGEAGGIRKINRREMASAQQVAVLPTVGTEVPPHDGDTRVDPSGRVEGSVGEIDRRERVSG